MPDSIPQRTCNVCRQPFPLTAEYWHKNKRSGDGFARHCKVCAKARAKDWYHENTERSKQSARQWRIDHPEEYRAHNQKNVQKRREYSEERKAEEKRKAAEYRKRTNDRRCEYNRAYRKNNPDWYRRICKAHHQRHLEKRRAYSRVNSRLWQKNNPIRVRMNGAKRAARLRGAGGAGFTKADYQLQMKAQGGNCWWCGRPMGKDVTIDHITPIIRGGQHDPRNIVLAHKSCNCSKKDKLPHEWNGRLL